MSDGVQGPTAGQILSAQQATAGPGGASSSPTMGANIEGAMSNQLPSVAGDPMQSIFSWAEPQNMDSVTKTLFTSPGGAFAAGLTQGQVGSIAVSREPTQVIAPGPGQTIFDFGKRGKGR